ncbi:MAG: hypothetical protein B6244_10090 [Candidatus Cloacimonetes bacterium 4572_55]|nr:MAG: hypothetical protein B6244_10090 [Candidatus Cloacimonetes bacterium 4572_55]
MIDHDKDELKSEGEFEDIQEKFKLLLQNHMTRLIFRSKIPGFDNQEVDDLFFKMESEQEKGLANEESIWADSALSVTLLRI